QCAYTGVIGGIYNVLVNLKDIADKDFVSNMKLECDKLKIDAQKSLKEVLDIVEGKLNK
ncbi:MAG: cyclodeaminase/cyclohydrolase family protein, partial [Melioribacteraceae bacterium]|nr:cyclodeaminase/cyclohydrolase family protein [Melioribacteraceae bacterium]